MQSKHKFKNKCVALANRGSNTRRKKGGGWDAQPYPMAASGADGGDSGRVKTEFCRGQWSNLWSFLLTMLADRCGRTSSLVGELLFHSFSEASASSSFRAPILLYLNASSGTCTVGCPTAQSRLFETALNRSFSDRLQNPNRDLDIHSVTGPHPNLLPPSLREHRSIIIRKCSTFIDEPLTPFQGACGFRCLC